MKKTITIQLHTALIILVLVSFVLALAMYASVSKGSLCDPQNRNQLENEIVKGDFSLAEQMLRNNCSMGDDLGNGATVLHFASQYNKVSFVKSLLEKNINPDPRPSTEKHMMTPLAIAVIKGEPEIVKLLLDYGANADDHGQDLIGFSKTPEIAHMLLSHGADINRIIKDKSSAAVLPIHDAVDTGRVEVAKFLIEHGAKINTKRRDGKTPIHIAVSGLKDELVSVLLEHSADPCIKDQDGKTAVDLAFMPITAGADSKPRASIELIRKLLMENPSFSKCKPKQDKQ